MSDIKKIKIEGTEYLIKDETGRSLLSGKELIQNKTTEISSASTDVEYPSAKAVYDAVEESKLAMSVSGSMLTIKNASEGGGEYNIESTDNTDGTQNLLITDAGDNKIVVYDNSIDTTKKIKQVQYNGTEIPLVGGGGFNLGPFNITADLRSLSGLTKSASTISGSNIVPVWGSISGTDYWVCNVSWWENVFSASLNSLAIFSPVALVGSYATNPLNSAFYIGRAFGGSTHYEIIFLADCTITVIASCLLPDTLITLSDGTRKAIKDITYQDELKVWDFDNGEFSTAPICWLTRSGLHNDHLYRLTFSDGSVVDFTGHKSNHKVYNVDTRKFEGVNVTEIGDRIFSENGIVTVTNKEYIEQDVEYYNLITTGKINCFANGILTADRYGNLYPIDEQMKYIKNDRPIRPYSEFEPHKINKYWYDTLRLGELAEDIDDTISYIGKLECQMKNIELTK